VKTQMSLFESSLICGAEGEIQMHHVKHLRKENDKTTSFQSIMSKLNRKQIPVCTSCHHKIHVGKYDGVSLNSLQEKKNKKCVIE
jgi:predicted HNH restriction endonuclease